MSIQKITFNGKTVIYADFQGLKEQAMMDQVDEVLRILLEENRPQLMCYVYNKKNYATPTYMRHLEEATKKGKPFVDKSVVVAELNWPKRVILKAYNLLFDRNVIAFSTSDEALRYLTDDATPSFLKRP
jgi:hypothetical protein